MLQLLLLLPCREMSYGGTQGTSGNNSPRNGVLQTRYSDTATHTVTRPGHTGPSPYTTPPPHAPWPRAPRCNHTCCKGPTMATPPDTGTQDDAVPVPVPSHPPRSSAIYMGPVSPGRRKFANGLQATVLGCPEQPPRSPFTPPG